MSREQWLHDLIALVEWRDPPHQAAQCAALERAHLVSVAARLNDNLAPGVRAELESLPDAAYMAILGGGDTYFAAHYGPAGALDQAVSRWIAVERAAVGDPTPLHGVTRSAACDRHVVATSGRVRAIEPLGRLTETRIALDFDSELSDRFPTRFTARRLIAPSDQERQETAAKLDEAMRLLDTSAEVAARHVRRMVSVVCCRTAINDQTFYTASDPMTLGVVHLMNAHLSRKSAAVVAGELVHEAIHQALFRYELDCPLLDEALADEDVKSPWTGADLKLYDLVHACFVWYGLIHLWRLPAAPALEPVTRQLAVAEAGFARDPLAAFGRHVSRLPSELRGAIQRMTAAVA